MCLTNVTKVALHVSVVHLHPVSKVKRGKSESESSPRDENKHDNLKQLGRHITEASIHDPLTWKD